VSITRTSRSTGDCGPRLTLETSHFDPIWNVWYRWNLLIYLKAKSMLYIQWKPKAAESCGNRSGDRSNKWSVAEVTAGKGEKLWKSPPVIPRNLSRSGSRLYILLLGIWRESCVYTLWYREKGERLEIYRDSSGILIFGHAGVTLATRYSLLHVYLDREFQICLMAHMKMVSCIRRICMVCIRITESAYDSANAYANGYGSFYIYGPWTLERSVKSINKSPSHPK
jgi:hypothetical protein